MPRYRDTLCKLCRREGTKLYLKGTKCDSAKCTLERRNFAPGQHGKRRSKLSEYGMQLREKQKLRRIYGVREHQFGLYFKKASRKKGVTGHNLLQLLETRLDNVTFRMGFCTGRQSARQFVRHGHVLINGKKVDIPSYLLKEGDVLMVKGKDKIKKAIANNLEITSSRLIPEWIQLDKDNQRGKILRMPKRADVNIPVDEHLIVELYSK